MQFHGRLIIDMASFWIGIESYILSTHTIQDTGLYPEPSVIFRLATFRFVTVSRLCTLSLSCRVTKYDSGTLYNDDAMSVARYDSAIRYLVTIPKYRLRAQQIAKEEKLLDHLKRNKKMSKDDARAEEEKILREIVRDKMDIR